MPGAPELLRQIEASGALTDPEWKAAFAAVRRELFVPYYYVTGPDGAPQRLWRDDPDPELRSRWLAGVYDDVPLATRVRDGDLVSSSSQPSLMARMLEALQVHDGMNVLEIGAGSGYNAALLAHRLGDALVTTVDVDPAITSAAREHLAAAGHRPRVVTGDGTRGAPAHGPYDRIIATCELSFVPSVWLSQCTTGALVLAPLGTGLVSLRVTDEQHASGRFHDLPVFFVPLRSAEPGQRRAQAGRDIPRHAQRHDSFQFLFGLTAGSMEPHEVYELWRTAGRPGRERYGVTLRKGEQWAWLDSPDGPCTWPLAGS